MHLLAQTPVIERLKVEARSLRQVGAAADLAAGMKPGGLTASPSAFVILSGAEPFDVGEGSGPLRQTFDVTQTVLVGVNLAGAKGEAGLAKLETPVGEVRGALFGWSHPDAEIKFRSGGEGVEEFDAKTGVLLYRLDFITRVRLLETYS
ncbi:hypothetical protein [Phenylobacterium sp.]|uniref:phage tail terminator protein n=1 Tax=Phenylobacterium sp. TaxID=1871053 RepID=UPI00273045BC|nr:hypothetical protein [Phenylobacterium sp.]MDP1617341.1 hypothetical protein [Phenylobacterium sp.]